MRELCAKPAEGDPWAWLDYELPARLIAQTPCAPRDQARLLVVHRSTATIAHHVFHDLPDLLQAGDLLVLNDTAVLPARLLGHRTHTRGKWEGLYLHTFPDGTWEVLSQTRGRLTPGETIDIEQGPLRLELVAKLPNGHWQARPSLPSPLTPTLSPGGRGQGEGAGAAPELLARYGHVPLPPYIRKGRALPEDRERYQTVYAKHAGAVAAPTAGLHFTAPTFERLAERGIGWTFVTLHVGLGTFLPIQTQEISRHRMHAESAELPAAAGEAIEACRARGGRVVAVGTTSLRVLETVAASGELRLWSGETDLFIYPPYEFRAVDALLTNFHLPRSTLLLLVGAFAGVDLIQHAYKTAIDHAYRFFSYGDAMLIL